MEDTRIRVRSRMMRAAMPRRCALSASQILAVLMTPQEPSDMAVISNRANRIKNDASIEELEAVLHHLKEITNGPRTNVH